MSGGRRVVALSDEVRQELHWLSQQEQVLVDDDGEGELPLLLKGGGGGYRSPPKPVSSSRSTLDYVNEKVFLKAGKGTGLRGASTHKIVRFVPEEEGDEDVDSRPAKSATEKEGPGTTHGPNAGPNASKERAKAQGGSVARLYVGKSSTSCLHSKPNCGRGKDMTVASSEEVETLRPCLKCFPQKFYTPARGSGILHSKPDCGRGKGMPEANVEQIVLLKKCRNCCDHN